MWETSFYTTVLPSKSFDGTQWPTQGALEGHLVWGPLEGHLDKQVRLQVDWCVLQNGTLFVLATECQLVGRLSPIAAKWRLREDFRLVQVERRYMKRAHCWKATAEIGMDNGVFIVLEPAL